MNERKKEKVKNAKPIVSKAQRKAMQKHSNIKDNIITSTGKGGAVVVIGIEKYIREARR